MKIKRDIYLDRLIRREKNGLIKIVTGVRRCGKSYLLFNLFHNYLLEKGVREDHIIEIALDDRSNKELRDPDNMLKYVKERIVDKDTYYIILDEVQLLAEFEDVLNSFMHIRNADVYVTGSNSKFLSSDLVTEFRGRGDEIRIYPLSFREYCSVYEGSADEAWDDYFTYGGLPLILSRETTEEKAEYLMSLFQKVYLSDIIDRHKVRHQEELDELVFGPTHSSRYDVVYNIVGKGSVKEAEVIRCKNGASVNFMDAFLVSKAVRYDIKGRKYIGSPAKFYFEDVGLRNARLNFRQMEENHIMENIIYNELRIRGYHVDVGLVEQFGKNSENKTTKKQLEVDFVVTRGSEKYYIQSAFAMNTEGKREQEERPLNAIGDSFKKIIVVRDNIKVRRNDMGIVTIGVRNFLLDEHSLSL